jgi:hypothetical protein
MEKNYRFTYMLDWPTTKREELEMYKIGYERIIDNFRKTKIEQLELEQMTEDKSLFHILFSPVINFLKNFNFFT